MASSTKVATKWLKTAGEVRFIKDHGGDEKQWGWSLTGPSEREMPAEFEFNSRNLKPLALSLRAALAALGHVQSAYNTFTKIKSATISPDGNIGGKGYIQRITDIRRQFMNCSEALSAITDTLYDELHASHWNPAVKEQSTREREEVVNIMQDVDEIRKSPESWAEEEEEEMDEDSTENADAQVGKTATILRVASRHVLKVVERRIS